MIVTKSPNFNYYESTVNGITFSKDQKSWEMYYYGYDPENDGEVEGFETITEETLWELGIDAGDRDALIPYFEKWAIALADKIINGEIE